MTTTATTGADLVRYDDAEKSLLSVASCTWHSSPMTMSQVMTAAGYASR